MNFGVLLTALIGSSFGIWLYVRNRAALQNAFYCSRLVLDTDYREACMRMLSDERFHAVMRAELRLLPMPQHIDALTRGRSAIAQVLGRQLATNLRRVSIELLAIGLLPFIVFFLLHTGVFFIVSTVVALTFAILLESLLFQRPSLIEHRRMRLLVDAVYAGSGYRGGSAPVAAVSTAHAAPVATSASSSPLYPYPVNDGTLSTATMPATLPMREPQAPPPTSGVPVIRLESQVRTVEPEDRLLDDITVPAAPPPRPMNRLKYLQFSSVWWALDTVVCFVAVMWFWGSEMREGRLVDLMVIPIAIILMLQVFFIPMYFTIRVTRRLLRDHPY